MATKTRIEVIRFVDAFLRSEYVAHWQDETIEAGGYSRSNSDARDRYDRCYAGAEDGADGSTHREVIDDWRAAFRAFLQSRTHPVERFADAVEAHFDAIEQWHADHGSLDQEIG